MENLHKPPAPAAPGAPRVETPGIQRAILALYGIFPFYGWDNVPALLPEEELGFPEGFEVFLVGEKILGVLWRVRVPLCVSLSPAQDFLGTKQ